LKVSRLSLFRNITFAAAIGSDDEKAVFVHRLVD
jgi:hypothetical protein